MKTLLRVTIPNVVMQTYFSLTIYFDGFGDSDSACIFNQRPQDTGAVSSFRMFGHISLFVLLAAMVVVLPSSECKDYINSIDGTKGACDLLESIFKYRE